MSEIWSHSRLSSFEDCRRKFQYRYRLQIPTELESIEGFVGKRVHDVLERLYRVAQDGRVPSLPKVIARYCQLFDDAYDARVVRIVRREFPLEYYRELGEHCLANYYHEHYPFDRDETLGLEERILFDLGTIDGERVQLQGFIDRIARARDGAIEIHDYKTGARVPSQKTLDEDRQLALYQMGVARTFGVDQPFRLVWHYVRKGVVRTSTRTAGQLDDLREQTLTLVRRIRSEQTFEPRQGPLCRWCEFNQRCPASPERRMDLPTWEETLCAPVATTRRRGRAPARSPTAPEPAADQLTLPLEAH